MSQNIMFEAECDVPCCWLFNNCIQWNYS